MTLLLSRSVIQASLFQTSPKRLWHYEYSSRSWRAKLQALAGAQEPSGTFTCFMQGGPHGPQILALYKPWRDHRTSLASSITMVKPLSFKGDKKSRKRKAPHPDDETSRPIPEKALLVAEEALESNEDDSWVTAEAPSDIIGPVIVALPSTPPACIACDANGKVFTIELENILDGNIATAEPHDVRQVWVASRVAGTENISFKGHQQRYVRPVGRGDRQ